MSKEIGVITEQGFVAGQLGFIPVKESDLNLEKGKDKDKEKQTKD